jgi:glycosyltransferase involved in cell wall biosynthesis
MYKINPTVSIILPTYNRLEYLQRSIGSVLGQTYQDWELIIWDDGSADGTGDFCKSLADKRIQYFTQENHGMSYALNRAIERSKGEFVAFLDDDDEWLENKLECQLALLKPNKEIDMIFGNFENYYENGKIPGLGFDQTARAMSALRTYSIGSDGNVIIDGLLEGLSRDNFIAFDSTMIRRKVLDSVGFFNQGLRNGMDLEYWWRFGLAGYKASFTNIVVLKRYKYANSLSGRNGVSIRNHIKALDSCSTFSRESMREETLKFLKPAYRNAWQNMISACAMENDKKGMMAAFKQSLKYGFRPGSLRLLVEGLLRSGDTR